MGRGGRAERDSCQWLVERCRLNPHERCRKCVDLDSYTPSEISNRGIQYKGVCLLLPLMSSPVKKVIRFAISSPRKKKPQRVRQKPVRYEAEPANSAKMHAERSVKAASLQAKMEKAYTDSTQYFLEDPIERLTTNI